MRIPTQRYIIYTMYSVLVWSSLSILTDNLQAVPSFFALSIAFATSGLLSLPFYRKYSRHLPTLAVGIVGIFGFHALFFFALKLAPPIEATILVDIWPLLIILLTPLLLPQFKLRLRHYISMTLGLAGSLLIISGGSLALSTEYMVGYALALFAGLIWAAYSLFNKVLPDFHPATIGLFCLAASVGSFIIHIFLEPPATPTTTEYLWMILMGAGPLGSAFYTWNRALREGDPRVIGALSFLIPLLSAVWLILFGNHKLYAITLLAMIIIVAASVIGSLEKKSRKKTDSL